MQKRKLTEKDTLGYLGDYAQLKILKYLIDNPKHFIQLYKYINVESFTTPELKLMAKTIINLYEKNNTIPTYKDIEYVLKNECKTNEGLSVMKETFNKLYSDNINDGLSTVGEIGIGYFKKNELVRVLTNGLQQVKNNEFSDDIVNHIMEGIHNISNGNSGEEEIMADELVDIVFNQGIRERIPCGIKELDEQMNGGLPKKSLGLVIAGTGVGKTTFGSIMAIGAALNGYNVMHIFFEDTVSEIGQKYYAALTGKYTNDFSLDNPKREELKKEIISNKNYMDALHRIRAIRMENGETTVEDIRSKIVQLRNVNGWNPDMLIIDYLSCMKTTNNETLRMQNEWQAFERMTKRLESMAMEFNLAIWAEQQTNRDAFKADTANNRIGNVQGSFRITQPCSFILYLSRASDESGSYNRANLYLDKCRGCQPKSWENIYLNNGTCQINLSDEGIQIGYKKEDLEYNEDMAFDPTNGERFKSIINNEVF